MVYEDNKWIIADRDQILEELIHHNTNTVSMLCVTNDAIPLSKEKLDEYCTYFESIDPKDKSLKKKIGIVILNNSEQVHT
jgi:hypothetical protein